MILSEYLSEQIKSLDNEIKNCDYNSYESPNYDPETHYEELTRSGYFYSIIVLRQILKSLISRMYNRTSPIFHIKAFSLN
ncbi:hypothetical protein MHK_000206 [Candidatus Magnetomorum sp. HK-1]|nr:hypothetical protein MHK_000206 [Candidatus Magnetomorum sp. HK-1]